MTPEMALHICILLAIVGVAMLAAMGGMALLVVAVVLMVWPKMPRGDEVSVFPIPMMSKSTFPTPGGESSWLVQES
jgi:hypothetical protein